MADPHTPHPTLPARLADRYALEERLGGGGSAEVWRALDGQLQRQVAIKLLYPHLLIEETSRARFEQEARAAATLAHPGIVSVYDAVADNDGAAIVFELVDGESLAARLRRDGRLPPAEAARIGAEVADALFHAHKRGVIHRDVKPANVMLDRDGHARLLDFGIARLLAEEANRLTATGTITGTLHYLAPEQLAGATIGPRADVYAVGVLLAEMVGGAPPYAVTTPVALAEAQRTPPATIRGAPAPLADVIRGCLDPDPERRPRSAGALADELRALAPALPTHASVPADEVPTATAPAIARPTDASPGAPPPRRRAWRPLAVTGLAGAALVLLLAALALNLSAQEPGAVASLPPSTPAATATPIATPASTPQPDLAAAAAAFSALVDAGEQNGQIERGAANDLRHRAEEVVKKFNEGKLDEVARKLDELGGKVDEFEQRGRIASADLAADLRAAVEDMRAAAEG